MWLFNFCIWNCITQIKSWKRTRTNKMTKDASKFCGIYKIVRGYTLKVVRFIERWGVGAPSPDHPMSRWGSDRAIYSALKQKPHELSLHRNSVKTCFPNFNLNLMKNFYETSLQKKSTVWGDWNLDHLLCFREMHRTAKQKTPNITNRSHPTIFFSNFTL